MTNLPPIDVPGLQMWALVDSAGQLVRGRGAVSAEMVEPGRYDVAFDRGVGECIYLSTLRGTGQVMAIEFGANIVRVTTTDSSGQVTPVPFMLAVLC